MSFAEGTQVPVSKTRGEIEALVERYGATRFASGWTEKGAAINFVAKGRLVRFELAMPTAAMVAQLTPRGHRAWHRLSTEEKIAAETRRRWRSLLLSIKAKLEAVDSGIATFDEEFLAHIVTAENITVYEAIQLQESGIRMLGPAENT